MEMAEVVSRLCEARVRRQSALKMCLRINNNCLAGIRRSLGFQTGDDEEAREKVCAAAQKIKTAIENQKAIPKEWEDHVPDTMWSLVAITTESRAPQEAYLRAVSKEMEQLAKELPVWEWVEAVRGVGALGLAGIVGEAGDLSNYANPGKLWKRFGLAPYEGKAYATLPKEGGLAADQWEEAGYCPRRRSVMFNVGEALIKSNGDGPYKGFYDARKAYELKRDPEMTKLHAHNRAKRYMEKRFLRDLWKAWTSK